jgi:putative transposase
MISASNRSKAIELIKEAVISRARLFKACAELGITERTYYRWVKQLDTIGTIEDLRPIVERPEPANKLSKQEREQIIDTVNQPGFASMPPCEIVPALADKGEYIASESTFYRVLRECKMQNHRGRSQESTHRPISTHVATAPNQVWMWDITYINGPVKGTFYYLYLISDLFSRDIVGWEVWNEESAEHASELIKRASLTQNVLSTDPLVLHSDNGSPMKGATMLATLYQLGITPSNSRPRVSNDNPYAESLFKTLKYRPNYQPKGFGSLGAARLWCSNFVSWYRHEHHHSGIKFLTPAQRHSGDGEAIMKNRTKVYEAAKAAHPERWNGRDTRDWSLPIEVFLNPEQKTEDTVMPDAVEKAA